MPVLFLGILAGSAICSPGPLKAVSQPSTAKSTQSFTPAYESLRGVFLAGEAALGAGRMDEAEGHFKLVVSLDSNDWEAHERLAQIYQREGRIQERNAELEKMRSMAARGRAWRNFILRDQFIHKGLRITTAEIGLGSSGPDRKFLISISNAKGTSSRLISMTRTRKGASFEGEEEQSETPGIGFKYTIRGESKIRTYFVPAIGPNDSDPKQIILRFLDGR